MAADRGAYIDQSQSLNLHFAEPDKNKLNSAHFYAWKMVCMLTITCMPYLFLPAHKSGVLRLTVVNLENGCVLIYGVYRENVV